MALDSLSPPFGPIRGLRSAPDRIPPARRAVRTLFLSDLHLGALGSRPDLILALLCACRAEKYVLVGDVLDLWYPLLPHWTDTDQAVIDFLRARMADGAEVVYVRGNHDPLPERAPAHARLDVTPVEALVHQASDGRRYLVLHGDAVDSRFVQSHAMTRLGSLLDHGLRRLDQALRPFRRAEPRTARTAIEALLSGVNALAYARRRHEARLVDMARAAGLDGVICGHFHLAALHDDLGLTYANCGDWVDSFTAVEEHFDGSLRLRCVRALVGRDAPAGHALGGQALGGDREPVVAT